MAYRKGAPLSLSVTHVSRLQPYIGFPNLYPATSRWLSSSPESLLVTKVRSIAIEGQKLGTTNLSDAWRIDHDRAHSEILVPLLALVFHFLAEQATRNILDGRMPPILSPYRRGTSELRRFVQDDKNRVRAFWPAEQRETFLGLLDSLDEAVFQLLRILRNLLVAMFGITLYVFLPCDIGSMLPGSKATEERFSERHSNTPHEGDVEH